MPDGVWQFRLAQRSGLILWDPQDKKRVVPWNVFTGWTWDELERAEWKGYWPEIGPGDVRKWIETHDLTALCEGSQVEQKPDKIEGAACYRFRPEQLRCPVCGESVHPVCRAYPDHFPVKTATT